MLNRLLIVWIVFAGIMGFVLGGSFVSAYLSPPPQHHSSALTENSEQDSKEKADEALARYTLWLTVFTGVLAFATVGLGIATVGLYVTGEKQIEAVIKSANAADLSARAAIAIELPVIRTNVGKLGWGDTQDEAGRKRHFVYIDDLFFSNLGRTQAFPTEVECGCTFGEILAGVPTYTCKKILSTNTIFKPETENSYEVSMREFEFDVPADAYDRIRSQSAEMWVYCNLIYLDFMQNRHESAFCWRRYQGIGPGRFIAESKPAYNRKT
jgi:hypothetical protein